jgi:phage antirepressor YoqD-like protein
MMETIHTPVLTETGNNNVTYFDNAGILVNATQMAKPFGKKPADWLRLSSTKRLLQELGEMKKVPVTELVRRTKKSTAEGIERSILLQEDAAMEFARWLSPAFIIWSNYRMKELMLTGKTTVDQQANETVLLETLSPLVNRIALYEESVLEQARKLDYHDAVLQSRTLITTNVIAKELGMSAISLNKLLHAKKVIYKSDDHWVLYAEHAGKGYTGTKTAVFQDSSGNYQSNIHTYWTEKGRQFIHSLLKEENKAA